MRRYALAGVLASLVLEAAAAAPDWLVASPDGRAVAGEIFQLIVVSTGDEPPPEELDLRVRTEVDERTIPLRAVGPATERRRTYAASMPTDLAGPLTLDLAGRSSSVLQLTVTPKADAVRSLRGRRVAGQYEPPLSENDPMYFIFGARDGYSARFQLSFKYRLFDTAGPAAKRRGRIRPV